MIDRRPLLQRLIEGELASLTRAAELVENAIEQELALLRERGDEVEQELWTPGTEAFFDHLADEYQAIEGELSSIMRSAVLLRAYAALEHYLIALCWIYAERAGIPLNAEDVRTFGVDDARRFLKKAGARFPDRAAGWQELKRFVTIRHLFAHRGGRLTQEELTGHLGAEIGSHPDLTIEGFRIHIGSGYFPRIIDELDELYRTI